MYTYLFIKRSINNKINKKVLEHMQMLKKPNTIENNKASKDETVFFEEEKYASCTHVGISDELYYIKYISTKNKKNNEKSKIKHHYTFGKQIEFKERKLSTNSRYSFSEISDLEL